MEYLSQAYSFNSFQGEASLVAIDTVAAARSTLATRLPELSSNFKHWLTTSSLSTLSGCVQRALKDNDKEQMLKNILSKEMIKQNSCNLGHRSPSMC